MDFRRSMAISYLASLIRSRLWRFINLFTYLLTYDLELRLSAMLNFEI